MQSEMNKKSSRRSLFSKKTPVERDSWKVFQETFEEPTAVPGKGQVIRFDPRTNGPGMGLRHKLPNQVHSARNLVQSVRPTLPSVPSMPNLNLPSLPPKKDASTRLANMKLKEDRRLERKEQRLERKLQRQEHKKQQSMSTMSTGGRGFLKNREESHQHAYSYYNEGVTEDEWRGEVSTLRGGSNREGIHGRHGNAIPIVGRFLGRR